MRDPTSYFLVEWYRNDLSQDTFDQAFANLTRDTRLLSGDGESATVVLTMSVPTDDVIFSIFSATSSEVVVAACERAGIPAQRVTAAMVAA
jgi:hypothetical protein